MERKHVEKKFSNRIFSLGSLLALLVLALSVFFAKKEYSEDLFPRSLLAEQQLSTQVKSFANVKWVKVTTRSLTAKYSKFRKKFKQVNNDSIDFQRYERQAVTNYSVPLDDYRGYEAPHFLSEQHSFLYRLTYF